jgi:galactose mutarotase-like enzyme
VGGLKNDTLHHRGTSYAMPKHGFARDLDFTWIHRSTTSCTLELRDSETTRKSYPFAFRLTVTYTLEASGLRMELEVHNPGEEPLPASLGLHPAFRWPLAPGLAETSHQLVFDSDEPGPMRRLDAHGLLTPTLHETPIQNRVLKLNEGLFQEDALLFLEPHSRGLRFETEDGPSLTLRWEGFPHLGVWTKPVAKPGFLCIEPWQGHADPADWDGEFAHKPGGFLLQPGARRQWALNLQMGTKHSPRPSHLK